MGRFYSVLPNVERAPNPRCYTLEVNLRSQGRIIPGEWSGRRAFPGAIHHSLTQKTATMSLAQQELRDEFSKRTHSLTMNGSIARLLRIRRLGAAAD